MEAHPLVALFAIAKKVDFASMFITKELTTAIVLHLERAGRCA